MKEEDFEELIEDVESILNIGCMTITRYEGNPWTRFAKVELPSRLFTGDLSENIKSLEDNGYIVSTDHESGGIVLYVDTTRDSATRVLDL